MMLSRLKRVVAVLTRVKKEGKQVVLFAAHKGFPRGIVKTPEVAYGHGPLNRNHYNS